MNLYIAAQDSNPKTISGEAQRYIGMKDCFKRYVREIIVTWLYVLNIANSILYLLTDSCNLISKDILKIIFPAYNKDTYITICASTQIASDSFAGAAADILVYWWIYANTFLGGDIRKSKY